MIRHAVETSTEIVVFGSRASGLQGPSSDLDLLCISRTRTLHHKDRSLDLLCLSITDSRTAQWRGSELAGHIAAFGVLLEGDGDALKGISVGKEAIQHKRQRIEAYVRALSHKWFALDRVFKVKYAIKLRRETQRLYLLEQGVPIPPTRVLDEMWNADRRLRCSDVLEVFSKSNRSVALDFERTLQTGISNQSNCSDAVGNASEYLFASAYIEGGV